jgi:hypothetical protein
MGILGRVKGKMRGGLRKVRGQLKSVHEESKFPGRPPGHQAQDNPLWQDADVAAGGDAAPQAAAPVSRAPENAAPEATPSAATQSDAPALPDPTDKTDRNDEPFWFLKDNETLDGWDQTNPSDDSE